MLQSSPHCAVHCHGGRCGQRTPLKPESIGVYLAARHSGGCFGDRPVHRRAPLSRPPAKLMQASSSAFAGGAGGLATRQPSQCGSSARGALAVTCVATPSRPPASNKAKRSKVELIKEKSDFLRHPLMQVGARRGWLAPAPHAALRRQRRRGCPALRCQLVPGCCIANRVAGLGTLSQLRLAIAWKCPQARRDSPPPPPACSPNSSGASPHPFCAPPPPPCRSW